MALPDLSNLMYVARLRYIQSIHESPDLRNPDTLVGYFLPILQRWRAARLGPEELARLRGDPFYYYLVARTKYYDKVLTDAVSAGVNQIVSIGCGSDTRPYRFVDLLSSKGVTVLECDQPDAMAAKRRIARRWHGDHVQYLTIDLNDDAWPQLEYHLRVGGSGQVLVVMEGVSPYVNEENFCRFLRLMGTTLPPGSEVAYDFKLQGVKEHFGRVGRTRKPFRLPPNRVEVADFHADCGLIVKAFELSVDLCKRLLPLSTLCTGSLFDEDGLVQLQVAES